MIKKAEKYFEEACTDFEKSKQIYDEDFFVAAIRKAQNDAIDEAASVIKKTYPAGLTNTAKYVSDQVLKLKEDSVPCLVPQRWIEAIVMNLISKKQKVA
jgi:hypothetical protein